MTGPLNFDFEKLRNPSLPAEDEGQAGPLGLDLIGKLRSGVKTPTETGTELVQKFESDQIASVGEPQVQQFDPNLLRRREAQPGGTLPPHDYSKSAFISGEPSFAETVGISRQPFSAVTPGLVGGEHRAERLQREQEEYLRSPEKIAADLENTARIEAAPTGFANVRQKLASMRLFTDRSIVEFDNGNSSGFHVGVPIAHPIETAKELVVGLPRFFLDLVRKPAALVTDLTQGGKYLLPEEKSQYVRETIANYTGLLFGFGVGRTFTGAVVGRDLLRVGVASAERAGIAVPTGELELIAQTTPRALALESTIPGKIATGVVEGVAGGGFIGAASGQTPEEARNLAATYALMALPAGVAFEAIAGRIRRTELGPLGTAAVDAHNLSIIRQTQAASDHSLLNAANSFLALKNANDLAEAAHQANLDRPVVVQGVSRYKPTGGELIHQRPDGLMDITFGGVPEITSPVLQRYQSPDVALGSKLSEDIFDPGHLDPETGAPALVAKAGSVITPQTLAEINAAGYERIRTDKGWIALEKTVKSEPPLFVAETSPTISVPVAEVERAIEARDPGLVRQALYQLQKAMDDQKIDYPPLDPLDAKTTLEQITTWLRDVKRDHMTVRRGTEADRLVSEPGYRVGDVVEDRPGVTEPIGAARRTEAEAMYQVGGFFPHEIVGFLGNDYHYVEPVISSKGALEGHRIADANGNIVEVPWDQLRHGPDMAVNSFLFDKPQAQKALVEDFRRYLRKTTGEEAVPNKPFSDMVREYADSKNFGPAMIAPLVRFLSDEYGKILRNEALSPAEKVSYNRLVREASNYRKESAANLVDAATSSGMYIERQNGAIIIRESDTGAYLELAHSPEEALKFIQNVVEERGADFTPGSLPDGVSRGLIPVPPPPNGPHTSAFNPHENGWFGDLRDLFNVSRLGTKFTGMRQIMISLDNQLGTQFFSEVYQPLQVAHLRKFASMYKDMLRVAETSKLARGLTPDQLEQVTTSVETMHPEDMIHAGGLFQRAFTPRELEGAKWFIENKIDVRKAFQYYRGLKNLEFKKRFRVQPEAEKINAVHRLQASLNMDEAHIEAARIIGKVLQINKPGELSIYGITRLAEAVMDGHLRPDDYVARHFPPADTEAGIKMRQVREEVRSHFADLADRFDIPDEQRLGGYFAHLRNFKNDEIVPGRDGAPIYTSELLRTGEMSEYDRDPISVLARYVNMGYSNRFTKSALDHAYEYINMETARMTDPAHGDYVKRLLTENYVNELRGIPHASSSFAEKILNKILDRMKVKSDVSVRRDIVNTWLSLSSSATIGFRPMQGIRDFHNFSSTYYARFGAERLGDLYTIMARVTPQELEQAGIIAKAQIGESVPAAFAREGTIPTLAPVSVLTAQERLQNSIAARTAPFRMAIQKTADAGIVWGLQHNVYQWAHAASYLETSTRALSELNKLATLEYGTGDAAKAKAYDRLFINSYDPPVAAHFDRLVTDGKFKEAADFLGRATSFETVSIFGLANHPAGWGTNVGRMFGQFGNWPVWARTALTRMMSRGTAKERAGVAVRWGISQGALAAASATLGLNLNSWYLPTAAPLVSAGQHLAAAADAYDDDQTRELQQAAASIVLGVPGSTLYRGGPALDVVLKAVAAGSAYPQAEREAARALTQLPLLLAPGTFLARDIYEGAKIAENGDSPVSAWLRAFGIRSTPDESLLNPGGITLE